MVRLLRQAPVVASLFAPIVHGGPTAPGWSPGLDHNQARGADLVKREVVIPRGPKAPMIRRNGLVAREETRSISLEQTLENEPLFSSDDIPLFNGPSVQVSCRRCCSKGSIDATFPSDVDDILNPKFRIELTGVEVVVDLDVVVSDQFSFEVPLFKLPPGIANIQIPGFEAGLFFDLAVLFSLSAEVDFNTGFYMKIPDGSFFEIDISAEGVHSEDFTGVISKPLPILINNKNGTGIEVTIDLQLKTRFGLSAGTDVGLLPGLGTLPGLDGVVPGIGAGAEVGAFINLVEYKANVAPADTCALELTEELNVNVGAFAQVGVRFQDDFFGIEPTVTTTLFVLPLPTVCILDIGVPVPIRTDPLPTARECSALPPPPPPPGQPGGLPPPPTMTPVPIITLSPGTTKEPMTTITQTSTSIQTLTVCEPGKDCPADCTTTTTTPVPMPGYGQGYYRKRQADVPPPGLVVEEPIVTSLVAKVCNLPLAQCPQGELADMTFPVTVCPPAPTAAASDCFAGLGAGALTLSPTSIEAIGTGAPPPGAPPPIPTGEDVAAPSPAPDAAGTTMSQPPLPVSEATPSAVVGTPSSIIEPYPSVGEPDGGAAVSPPSQVVDDGVVPTTATAFPGVETSGLSSPVPVVVSGAGKTTALLARALLMVGSVFCLL